jgi:hypothetical protein
MSGGGVQLRFDIPGYDKALAEFTALVIKGVLEQDPILGQIRGGTTTHGGPRRNVRGPTPLDQPMTTLQQEFSIPTEVIRRTDTDAYAALLHAAATEYRDKLLTSLFRGVSEVTDATGNTIDAQGQPLNPDMLNDMLERIEFDFDEAGQPIMPRVVIHPDVLERLKAIEPTPEQLRRQAEILARKKAEHDAQKRTRRLSR